MKRGLDRATQSSVVGNGRERDGAFLSTAMSPSSCCNTSDAISGSSVSQDPNGVDGCCLGGWISSMLGGGGEGQGPPTRAAAAPAAAAAPNDDPTALVAEELKKLSLKDREKVYEDLHGVSMVEDESNQELVNQRLNEMNVEIEKIPRLKKTAYLIAMEEFGESGKEFCQDPSLLLMFLRANCWDSQKAATRFVGWLDWKLELFGRDVLCHRYITLDKLDKEGQNMVKSGSDQILPIRDTSGRTVIFDNIGRQTGSHVKSILQQFWYIMMSTVEDDVQTQRRGVVYIIYALDGGTSFSANDFQFLYDCSQMAPMLPVRVCSVHYCFNDPTIRPIFSFIQKSLVSHLRVRFRSHEGKHTEVQYSLMSYGIPVDVLPVTTQGDIQKSSHLKWCKRRKVRDSTLTNRVGGGREDDFYGIDIPGRYDVLLGKGKPIQNHLGNRRLLELIPMYCQEYLAAAHGNKQLIAEKIVKLVQEPSSSSPSSLSGHVGSSSNVFCSGAPRFLKQRDDGWWVPVTDAEAIDKVCRSIRAFRVSKNGSTTMASATRPVTTTTVVHDEETGGIPNPVSASSSTTGCSGPTTAATTTSKRVKVEAPKMISSDPSLSIWKEEDEDLNSLYDATTTTTTKEDSLLDLDGSDWDNNWDVI